VPQQDGRPLQLPIASQCFDRYWGQGTRPEWASIGEQLKFVDVLKKYGCDTLWFDAAWFEKSFPNGVGNWFPNKDFPNGLKPLGDKLHQEEMKFILWFEPERVAPDTQIANEHPEFVFGGKQGGLYKLNDPAARRFLTDLLFKLIDEYGLDVYRNDFNIDPLNYWRENDKENRQGITEIQYVTGHYEMWDEFIARKPGLWIDNCASGGRRIDLETISRSITLWRSDTSCWAGNEDWDQVQAAGLALYIPLTTAGSWNPSAYTVRSAATGGAILQFDFLGDDFDTEEALKAIEEIKENRKYWYGDFYPLLDPQIGDNHWAAYQLHRADLDAGMVLLFRRGKSPYNTVELRLHGINLGAQYKLTTIDEKRYIAEKEISGIELWKPFDVKIPEKRSSLLIRYEKTGKE
ncbi:MAG: alpha-galactosidase, partial [Planctomycetaceae bacterium]|nr:alpha-galactosidase [Planctomycetaceae bacterium]